MNADLYDLGYQLIRLNKGSKKAAFEGWNTQIETRRQIEQWNGNIGIRMTGGVCVIDLDHVGMEWAEGRGIDSPMIATTTKSFHLYFRHTVENPKSSKEEFGDLKATGYCVCPPSIVEGKERLWFAGPVPREELPLCPIPVAQRLMAITTSNPIIESPSFLQHRLRKYLAGAGPAVSGQGGHSKTLRLACFAIHTLGMSVDDAWPVFLEWNDSCQPPWSERDLRRKLEEAVRLKK